MLDRAKVGRERSRILSEIAVDVHMKASTTKVGIASLLEFSGNTGDGSLRAFWHEADRLYRSLQDRECTISAFNGLTLVLLLSSIVDVYLLRLKYANSFSLDIGS